MADSIIIQCLLLYTHNFKSYSVVQVMPNCENKTRGEKIERIVLEICDIATSMTQNWTVYKSRV